jgi:SAM-dependent methyltransferase
MPDASSSGGGTDAACYGDGCAAFYDEIYPVPSPAALRRLAALAGGGAVLEAGIGTGRYALALAAQGLRVHGIDASPAMLAALRRKPGGAAIPVTLGDFAGVSAPGRFALVCCLTDTLALLPALQLPQALQRLARSLDAGGALLLETSFPPGDNREELDIELDIQGGKCRYRARVQAPAPATLDAWAAQAGLVLEARWRDWNGQTWRGEDGQVLSLYRSVSPRPDTAGKNPQMPPTLQTLWHHAEESAADAAHAPHP